MKLSAIQVKFETSKYLALKRYAAKKEVSLEQELEETLNRLYRKLVPPDVREYIEEGEKMMPEEQKSLHILMMHGEMSSQIQKRVSVMKDMRFPLS